MVRHRIFILRYAFYPSVLHRVVVRYLIARTVFVLACRNSITFVFVRIQKAAEAMFRLLLSEEVRGINFESTSGRHPYCYQAKESHGHKHTAEHQWVLRSCLINNLSKKMTGKHSKQEAGDRS